MAVQTITSLASSLVASIASTVSSLEALAAHNNQIDAVAKGLQKLSSYIIKVQDEFGNSTTCIQPLREQILQSFVQCNAAMSPLLKQMHRLDESNSAIVNSEFWSVLNSVSATHTRLFSFYADLLQKGDEALQHESIASPTAEEHVSQAYKSTIDASNVPDIFSGSATVSALPIRARGKSDTAVETAHPPNYDDTPPAYTPSQTDIGEGPSNNERVPEKSGWFDGTNLRKSFNTMVEALRPKPEPFVSALCEAIVRGDLQQAQTFISEGVNMNGANEQGDTPIKLAIQHNQSAGLDLLLRSGADMRSRRQPALFYAASEGRVMMMEILLKHGAQISDTDASGTSYFVGVVKSGNLDGIRVLLDHGISAKTKDITGQPVIAIAVSQGNIGVVELLLSRGAKADSKHVSGQAILATAVAKKNLPLVRILLDYQANPDSKDVAGSRVISIAVNQSDVELTKLLLEHGASANGKSVSGTRALVTAVSRHHVPIMKVLLEHGADADAKSHSGQPALISVIEDSVLNANDKVDIVELLIQHGANANTKDAFKGHSALTIAKAKGNANLIELLLKHGAKEKRG